MELGGKTVNANEIKNLADALRQIEYLQAQLAEYETTGFTPGDIRDLQALCEEKGLTKYIGLIARAKLELVMNNDVIIGLDERVGQLETQLAESQRREKAAVEDLKISAVFGNSCGFCKHNGQKCKYAPNGKHENKELCWQWRGPQEAEKGVEQDV
jgi:hypothetical protein